MRLNTAIVTGALSLITLGVTACNKTEPTQQTQTTSTTAKSTQSSLEQITIGYQKSALTLLITREQKLLEQQFAGAQIQWKEFPAGPQTLEALSVGAIDLGFVGNTPPIFAQSADKNIRYAAYEAVPITSQALVTAESSPIKSIEDLRGKRIAVQKGSSSHELLGKILHKAGLTWADITPVWLPPADARAAFDQQAIDAWVIWDPFLSVAERDAKAKVLIDGSAFPATYQYYIANPKFALAHPEAISKFITATNLANQWMLQHPEPTVKSYAQAIGQDQQIAAQALAKRPKDITIRTLTADIADSQQKIADSFYQQHLIPNQITIKNALLSQ